MSDKVDLYDSAYSHYEADVYREIRIATYGEDLGQTSWVTNEESAEIPRLLQLTPASRVFEVGCGSGRYSLQLAETIGCSVLGVDLNEAGIRNAAALARERDLSGRVTFGRCDVSQKLPFPDASFDAVFANDVLCHIPGRPAVLREIFRVLRASGRFLFSDALVIGGIVSHQEIATRSSIGYYLFSPPGHNEELLRSVGFRLIEARDTTGSAAAIAERWRNAREQHRDALISAEGETNFTGVQEFLSCVQMLTGERRLLRFLYIGEKPE
ncbi:MAG TPA: methyltransferase domain-containing protein [Silvibacterium sp.]|nr:methyltransferase domain-containing protein [Silvibacterium sp.]